MKALYFILLSMVAIALSACVAGKTSYSSKINAPDHITGQTKSHDQKHENYHRPPNDYDSDDEEDEDDDDDFGEDRPRVFNW